jgi:photosystem II PsbY protein
MFAAMATSESAMAAQQMMALAEGDNRAVALLIPLVPAIGWVLFNILKPALNQVDKMRSAKGLVAGAGLGALAALAAAPQADAVQEIAQVADNDARGLIIIGLLLPAVGWVLFNILRPALNQIEKMQAGNTGKVSKRSVIGALGLGGASMLLAPHADAAQEIASVADSDARGLIIVGLLLPAVGWVLFNILQPALNQIEKMQEGNSGLKKARGIIGVTGISAAAASLLAAPQANAQVQELAQVSADTRPLILLFILAPAIGWVLFNILKPALNQIEKMQNGNFGKGGRRK